MDADGQIRELILQHGLDPGILVGGMGLQRVHHAAHVVSQRHPGRRAGGIEAAGLAGDGEQLGADSCVDVAVEINADSVGLLEWGFVGDRHGGSS